MSACFTVSMVSKRFGLSRHMVRRLVQEEILVCRRGPRGQYLFGPEELEKLARIVRLKEELGVNLAGIDIILRLLDRIDRLNKELEAHKPASKRRKGTPTIRNLGHFPAPVRVIERELVRVRVVESD